jgi:hypothetical protein
MYLGRFRQGDNIVLPLHATDGMPNGVVLSRPPNVKVFDASGFLLISDMMPALDTLRSVGLFAYRLQLSGTFAAGRYLVVYGYTASGSQFLKSAAFDVLPGGDPAGSIVSMYFLERPHANILVQKTDGAKRYFKISPYL